MQIKNESVEISD